MQYIEHSLPNGRMLARIMPKDISSPKLTWNEETLRAHILLPWLLALGIDPSNIIVEKTFEIRLGHGSLQLGPRSVRGRADILIRNASGESLFIVELKAPKLALTDDDRDQGISYARLLDRIAPFVLVSNGRVSKIYDTVTREELTLESCGTSSAFFASGGRLAAADDLRMRLEALEFFVGYSDENLRIFSSQQVERHIRPLLGTVEQPGKYVPALYVPRARVREAIAQFLDSAATVFALIGDSGVGKSNEMCALAQEFSQTHVVLFYPCHEISQAPDETIAQDFNWSFSQHLDTPQLMRHLARVASRSEQPVLVFLDALDESIATNFPETCSAFARHLSGMSGRIRLIVSTKSTEWHRFATLRRNPSGLHLGLKSGNNAKTDEAAAWIPGEPFALDEFSDDELSFAIGRYQNAFSLPNEPAGNLRTLCRVPFFLRVVSETHANAGASLPDDLSSNEIARRWLESKFSTMRASDQGRRATRLLAQRVFERARRGCRPGETQAALETVNEDNVRDLELDELVAHGVVVRQVDRDDRSYFHFHHSRIFHYLVARHVLRLDEMSAEAFREILPNLMSNSAVQGVLAWHLREAPRVHREALHDELHARAMLYASTYSQIYKRVMPRLRVRVPPYTEGEIGVGFTAGLDGVRAYGLYRVNGPRSGTVAAVSVAAGVSHFDALFEIGCTEAHGGRAHFGDTDPVQAGGASAREHLLKLVQSGGLDERVSPTLLTESVLSICAHWEIRKKLRLPSLEAPSLQRRQSLLPLNLHQLATRVQEYFGTLAHHQAWLTEQFKIQSPPVMASDDGLEYSTIEYSPTAMEEARKSAQRDVKHGVKFSMEHAVNDREIVHLITLIDQLRALGIHTIEQDILPGPDRPVTTSSSSRMDSYSDERAIALLQAFFSKGISAYKALVTSNMPLLGPLLRNFKQMPLSAIVSWSRDELGPRRTLGSLDWAFFGVNPGEDPNPTIYLDAPTPFFKDDPGTRCFVAPSGKQVSGYEGTSLAQLLYPGHPFGFGRRMERSKAAQDAPIRAFAYGLLARDLERISASDLAALLQ